MLVYHASHAPLTDGACPSHRRRRHRSDLIRSDRIRSDLIRCDRILQKATPLIEALHARGIVDVIDASHSANAVFAAACAHYDRVATSPER